MAASMLIGFLAGAAFNITDTYFVSRLGTNALAAMGYTFPVTMVAFGLSMGIGMGTASVLSRAIGTGNHHRVQRLTVDALLLALLLVGALIVLGLATMRPLFQALGADENTLPLVMDYMRIWYIGIAFLIIPMVGNNAIRSTGDTLSPSIIMTIDLGLNIVLDPILIFGWGPIPAMGIKGAALATVFCRALALIASLYILGLRKRMLTAELPSGKQLWDSWRQIMYVGLPASATHMLMPVAFGVLMRMVSTYGEEAVAAVSAGVRVERFAVIPILALATSLVPFVGQNWGAKQYERVQKAQRLANIVASIWGIACVVGIAGGAIWIAPIFTKDPIVRDYLVKYLWIIPIVFGLRGMGQNANASMNAINRPYHGISYTCIRSFALQLPLAMLGMALGKYTGILIGIAAADIIAGLLGVKWISRLYRQQIQMDK